MIFAVVHLTPVMSHLLAFVLIFVLKEVSLSQSEPSDHYVNSTCPTWTAYKSSTNSCECGSNIHGVVFCRPVGGCPGKIEVGVINGFCMTMNKEQTKTVVGSCPFSLKAAHFMVPSNTSQLDTAVCKYTKRTGQLCGQCVNETSPPVYSYYPQCVKCPAGTSNWARYLAVSLLPTTLFFLGAVIIKLQAASPHMNCYILLCQALASPIFLRRIMEITSVKHKHLLVDIYLMVISMWNLDFFRTIYTPFCLHPDATMLQVLSLDYITAAYPLMLIILTYILVTLHYHNCRLVVWLWKPFLRCCIHFQRQMDIRNSLVDAFATFLLLSYVKFLSVSFDILTPAILWDSREVRQPTVLYYNGTTSYFSIEHLPFAVLAITVLLVFTLLPILLLCLYPCRCFQRFLNRCHFRSQALHVFMDAFQGCYKNGTNGTRDCRYFAAIYLVIRVAVFLSLASSSITFSTSIICIVLASVILLLSCFHPYKKGFYNQQDIFLLLCMIIAISSAWVLQDHTVSVNEHSTHKVILYMLGSVPIVYPLCLVLYHIWRKSKRLQSATEWIRAFFSRSEQHENWAESLPRRVTMDETSGLIRRDKQ